MRHPVAALDSGQLVDLHSQFQSPPLPSPASLLLQADLRQPEFNHYIACKWGGLGDSQDSPANRDPYFPGR